MIGNFSTLTVNGKVYPEYWNCDICGAYFTTEDAGYVSNEPECADVCEECCEYGYGPSSGETIN